MKARTERHADRVRIIRATAARDETRTEIAGETGTATETEAAGDYSTVEEKRARSSLILRTPHFSRNGLYVSYSKLLMP